MARNFSTVSDSLYHNLTIAESEGIPEACFNLAEYYNTKVNNLDSFEHYIGQAINKAHKIQNYPIQIKALTILANKRSKDRLFVEAKDLFDKAIIIATNINDTLAMADLYYSIALFCDKKTDYPGFAENISQAIKFYHTQKEWDKKAKSLISWGIQYATLKDTDMALKKLNEALELKEHLSSKIYLYLLLNLGKNYRRQSIKKEDNSLFTRAIELLESGKQKADSLNEQIFIGDFRLALMDTYTLLDPPKYRYDLADEAINHGKKYQDDYLIYQGYLGKAQMLVLEDKPNEALKLRGPMSLMVQKLSRIVYRRSLNEINYNISKKLGRNKEALDYLEKFKIINDSILHIERSAQFDEISEKYENEKNQRAIESLSSEKERLLIQNDLSASKIRLRNLWIGLLSLLGILGTCIVYLRQKQIQTKVENRSLQIKQQLLRAQINPHFIFNSLNGIKRFYVEGKTEDANDFLADFSQLLRKILDRSDQAVIGIEEEIEFLRLYLELEKRRLNNQLDYHINFNPDNFEFDDSVPAFIIQPLVENAIWHGLKGKVKNGKITITVAKEQDTIHIEVIDNGTGLNNQAKQTLHDSKGLKLIRERLGINGSLQLFDLKEHNPNISGTKAILTLKPQI